MFINFKSAIIILLIALQSLVCSSKKNQYSLPSDEAPVSYSLATHWADSVMHLMTLDEKITFIGGDRIFFTNAIPRLNIPSVMMSDATEGVHLRKSFMQYIYKEALPKSTNFPAPLLLASTWNKTLSREYAQAVGEECRAGGIAVLLGPGMNIYRISQCGRNFEYFGEDPYLAARMIENYVKGVQSTGTIATLKHFVANNTDFYRRKSNSVVSERALMEIYTPAFKAGIDAGAKAVMTSYNQLNGEWCGQSSAVINDLLKKRLGFRWLVMTDWWSVNDGVKLINSGQDLEMPFRDATKDAKELVENKKVEEKNIDSMVVSTLRTLYSMHSFERKQSPGLLAKFSEHEQIALQTAREGIVLLKNEKNILPLSDTAKSILCMGDYIDKIAKGGGAAEVDGYNNVTLKDALLKNFGNNLIVKSTATDQEIAKADVVILSIGTDDSEGWDRPFDLPANTESKILHVLSLNKNVVILVNSGSGINMSNWNDKAKAIIYAWYLGQNGNTALAEILSGKVNPSGKLPVTIEKRFKDSPGYGYMQGEPFYSGWVNDEKNHPVYDVNYKEGVFVGYRWYEHEKIAPLFPFGYGLSYTTFAYNNLRVSKNVFTHSDTLEVTFTVTNTGKVTGAEISQLYVQDMVSSVPRPVKELKGFDKVELNPGESKMITIKLTIADFSFWDEKNHSWIAEPGAFNILIGASSTDIRLQQQIELK